MCDHCRTFKPLLEGADTTRYYERDRPTISSVTPPRNSAMPPRNSMAPRSPSDVTSRSCCSWRRTCCDGVCCNRVGNCCAPESETRYRPVEKPVPTYGYDYGQPAIASYPVGMPGAMMPDRVPCPTRKEKLPMCFGGDCQDSECTGQPDVNESTPRQSER
ncbi:uncharacterized protein LOC117166457 [Bombus vancouverensis nearcticus]|uniref:uncharacterized protein LOC117166457 n=1 Tax=Bombus vancouverensis nearcticus TaxID=2705178 RepID=UPI00402B133E